MAALADIADTNAGTGCALRLWVRLIPIVIAEGSHAEANGIPCTLLRQASTTFRITEIAELVQIVLRWNFAFMTGRGALAAPSLAKRNASGVRPRSVF